MSEIKGQLLGMLLVLSVFALVSGILYGTFRKTAQRIDKEVTSVIANNAYVYDI